MSDDDAYTRDSAEDQLQRVYFKAYRNLPNYVPHPDGMRPWLLTITRNVQSDAHRDTQRHERVFEPDDGHADMAEAPDVSPERAVQLKQAMEKVMAAVEDMPPAQAAVLWMVLVEERSHEEAGAKLGISEDASKVALSRARAFLKERLGNNLFSVPHPMLVLFFDFVHRLGHVWALVMAMVFASFAFSSREPAPELHAVATGVARVVAASAVVTAHAAEVVATSSPVEQPPAVMPVVATPRKRAMPSRPLVDSDKQGYSKAGLSQGGWGSSGDTAF